MKKDIGQAFGDAVILILLIPFLLAFLFIISIFKLDKSQQVFDGEEASLRMRGQI